MMSDMGLGSCSNFFWVYQKRFPDGKEWHGNWQKGRQQGPGKYIYQDGSEKHGIWEKGSLVKSVGSETKGSKVFHSNQDADKALGGKQGLIPKFQRGLSK